DIPRRGLYPPEDDAAARQIRFYPVLQLFHLAQYQAGADRLSDRADAGTGEGIHAAELLRQHTRYPAPLPAGGRPPGLSHSPRPRGDAVAELWHLQRLRALR